MLEDKNILKVRVEGGGVYMCVLITRKVVVVHILV